VQARRAKLLRLLQASLRSRSFALARAQRWL